MDGVTIAQSNFLKPVHVLKFRADNGGRHQVYLGNPAKEKSALLLLTRFKT